ncbi:phytoene/squalene synthase family protein [Roseisolibacter sp. H3M3-2]|uniref:phytoene/squalene synthase family protein n=1 Tax=Roseisolibacter sp. H3M3-2 TaxID=3031323 RepID=UPI0023DBF5A3|nr:phytoene/squalene synthase family protein [Roseisolibacter sp. H3M3-2]MDF1503270.1 phytoene/squalene synthase family protein [Roseisolibacter sp. H3M3-2]
MTAAAVPSVAAAAPARGAEAADARECARLVREHARTFHYASWLLPPAKRRAANALYAFCRVADDMVDAAGIAGTATVARRLDDYERALDAAIAGRPDGPIFRELHRVLEAYAVPPRVLHELLAGVARDLHPVRYDTWRELVVYCEGVASTVGEMCAYVFGVPGGPAAERRALRYARTLGVAMQLTNILRDVGEDARRGRCYLPEEDLAAFGLTADDVLRRGDALAHDERWRPFMAFAVGRARSLYEAAAPGIGMLALDAQRCASACATGYAGILGAIERIGYDTISQRASLGTAARGAVLWRAFRRQAPAPPAAADAPDDEVGS